MKDHAIQKRVLIVVLVVAALAAAGYGLYRSGVFEKIGSVEELQALIDSAGPMASIVYFLLQMMTVIVAPIPSNITMMAGSAGAGILEAVTLGVLAVSPAR